MIETVEVANVRCSGCAATIMKALEEEGFTDLSVDLSCEPRKVTASVTDEARSAQFRAILRKLGYPLYHEKSGMVDSAGLKAKSFVSCAVGKFVVNNNTK
ncbi:MAG: heavy-metal-associated domain-containing protein [Thiovulaceae bacterium]|nr:heavy-metal-associated domain-containing protein [Sulfurimonadaceae bacterium]